MKSNHDNRLNVLNDQSAPLRAVEYIDENPSLPLNERIQKMLNSSPIFIFMKGNAQMPQCGFSANSVGILNLLGRPYKTFNILTDPSIRQGVKEFANWPTYPQIYFNGKLIGGNDIITEMFENGELQELAKNL